MIYDAEHSVAEFLNAAAAKQPTPGGGSVAALAGALAASMGEMVLNYSVNKASLAAHRPKLEASLAQLGRARSMMVELIVEDQAAFEAYSAAKKSPDRPGKAAEIAQLSQACVAVPQSLAATAAAVVAHTVELAPIVNTFLLSDLAVAADLAMATVRCARHNVRANLGDLSTADAAIATRDIDAILAHALSAVQKAAAAIEAAGKGTA